MGRALRLVDRNARGSTALDELETQPALADPRIGDHARHDAVALSGALERRLEQRNLIGPTDEAREAARTRQLETRPKRSRALELVDRERLVHALDREGAQIAQGEEAFDEARRMGGEIDAVRRGELLHALREAHREALGRVVHPEVVADRPDHHLSRVDSDADREAHTVGAAQLVGVAAQLVLEMERGVAGPMRVVFVGDGRAEESHDPIARVLVDRPLEAMDAVAEDLEEAVQESMPLFGTELVGELH